MTITDYHYYDAANDPAGLDESRVCWIDEQGVPRSIALAPLLAAAIVGESANSDSEHPEPYRSAGDRLVNDALALID